MRQRKSDRDKVAETVTQRDRYSDNETETVRRRKSDRDRGTETMTPSL